MANQRLYYFTTIPTFETTNKKTFCVFLMIFFIRMIHNLNKGFIDYSLYSVLTVQKTHKKQPKTQHKTYHPG